MRCPVGLDEVGDQLWQRARLDGGQRRHLIALGAIFGKLLADSGGADQIVDTIVGRSSARTLPWAMALVGMIIGRPMFFEIGLVLLMPVILLVARRSGQPLMRVALPAIAGLSAMHGFVPPHPGPLAAVSALKADLGLTLGLGIIGAIPSVIIAGPIFSHFAARWVDVPVPELFGSTGDGVRPDAVATANGPRRTALATEGGPQRTKGGPGRAALATEERPDRGGPSSGMPSSDTPQRRRPSFAATWRPSCCRWC